MGDDITIGVTEIVNNIEVTTQPNDQIIDISVVDNTDEVTLNITPTVIEINVNKGSSYAKWGGIVGTLSEQEDLQDALDLKADLVDGKVPSSQLPSYVDDVIEVADYAALPAVGESGKIYITLDDNHIFRWTGSTYVEITDNTAVWGAITGTLSSQTDLSTALNTKALKTTTISTNAPLSGGGDLSANRTLSISQASASVDGYLSATDWATFNNKQPALGYTPANDSAVVHIEGVETVNGIKTFSNSTKFDYGINLKQDTTTAYFPNYTTIDGYNNGYIVNNGDARAAIFYLANNVSRVYNFPDANGTFALTSDLSPYALDSGVVHIAGTETITGAKTFSSALAGTSATFSSTVQASAFRLTGMTAGSGALYWSSDRVTLANYNASGTVVIEATGGTYYATFGGATYNNDFSGTGRFTGNLTGTSANFSGNVGIGTTSADNKLDVRNTVSTQIRMGTDQGARPYWNIGRDNVTTGNFVIADETSIKMSITNGGNVGIGTTSPSGGIGTTSTGTLLDIYDGTAIGNNGGALVLSALGNSSRKLNLGQIRTILTDGTPSAEKGDMTFSTMTGSTLSERMRITSGGQVQITQASQTFSDGLRIISGSSRWTQVISGSNIILGYNESDRGSFNSSTGIYTPVSDINKKKDFEESTIGLKEILELKPTLYRMKSDDTESEKELGFIAQEVKEFIPQAYVESGEFIGLNFNAIVAALVKSVQEQNVMLQEQNEVLEQLKAEIELLKAK